jgi:hypothetical protein
MKSAKLIPEHQFILDCAWVIQGRDSGNLHELEDSYKWFYRDIETLGRNLAELVAEEGTQANIEEYIEMFEAGFRQIR